MSSGPVSTECRYCEINTRAEALEHDIDCPHHIWAAFWRDYPDDAGMLVGIPVDKAAPLSRRLRELLEDNTRLRSSADALRARGGVA